MDPHLSLILINLLVKLGLAAAVAAGLVRWVEFKSVLFRDNRVLRDKVYLILWLVVSAWIGKALALGVWIKFAPANTLTGDLSFETTSSRRACRPIDGRNRRSIAGRPRDFQRCMVHGAHQCGGWRLGGPASPFYSTRRRSLEFFAF